jgi:hypothetical protein
MRLMSQGRRWTTKGLIRVLAVVVPLAGVVAKMPCCPGSAHKLTVSDGQNATLACCGMRTTCPCDQKRHAPLFVRPLRVEDAVDLVRLTQPLAGVQSLLASPLGAAPPELCHRYAAVASALQRCVFLSRLVI